MSFFIEDQARILERYFKNDAEFKESLSYLQSTLADFAAERLAPQAAKHDAEEKFSLPQFKELCDLGYLGLSFPERYGGTGLSPAYHVAGMETLSKADAGFALGVGIHHTMTDGIFKFANETLKDRVLRDLISGKKVGAFGLTESDSGSDAHNMRTSYRKDKANGSFVLNGAKFWITNALSANYFFVFARNADDPKMISAFLVEANGEKSFQVKAIKDKMGVRASDTGELVFVDHRLAKTELIGEEGQAFKYAMHMLNGGRTGIGAWAVGIAQASLEKYLTYAEDRQLFKQRLMDLDNTKKEVSEMLIMIKGARELAYAAAYDKGTDHPQFPMNAAVAKVAGTEAAFHVAQRVIQLSGGFGYLRESLLERGLRDALLGRIGEGANELLKIMVIPRFFYQAFEKAGKHPNW